MALNATVLGALMKANVDAQAAIDPTDRDAIFKAIATAVIMHIQTAGVVNVTTTGVTTCPAGAGTETGTGVGTMS